MKRALFVLMVVAVLAGVLTVPAFASSDSVPTVRYVVQPGDTLAKIGRQFCTSWQEIYAINRATIGPNPNILEPGMVLRVPNRCGGKPPPGGVHDHGPSLHARGTVNGNIYTVAFGDTMFSIANRFGLTVDQLAAANGISDSSRIYGGQKLIIPGLGPGPFKSFITITSPVPGAILPPTFVVTGTGGGLFEGGLVVRAVDNAGHVLAQQPATLQGHNVGTGGTGTYSVQITVHVTQNTAGKIVASASSPKDSHIAVSASVPVTFSPSTAKPFITITSPAANSVLPPTFTVTGTGGGLFEGGLVVRAVDNAGHVLAEQPTTLQGADVGAGGTGTYSVQITVHVTQKTAGKIIASASSPKDSHVVASASVPVTFSPSTSKPFITIESPVNGAVLPPTFVVNGTGGGLFEGSLVVRAQDKAGHILAEQAATLQGENVGAGGTGTYWVELTVNVAQQTPGQIIVFAPSPSGSGNLAHASVTVSFSASSASYKRYKPGQCTIQAKPNAPFYDSPGGQQVGQFAAGGSFDAIRGAKVSGGMWYEIYTDPGSGNPSVWAPASSTTSASAGCAF